jgi:hypothetical protein
MNTETLKRAYRRTLENQRGFDTDIPTSRRMAVANVKKKIISRQAINSVVDEWLTAKEQQKKWNLRK